MNFFDSAIDIVAGAMGGTGTGTEKVASGISNVLGNLATGIGNGFIQSAVDKNNNNAAMDRQQAGQTGATAGQNVGLNTTTGTTSQTGATTNNTSTSGSGTSATTGTQQQNQVSTEQQNLINSILNSKDISEEQKSQLVNSLKTQTTSTAGSAESADAINSLLTGLLDPSQYSAENAEVAAGEAMQAASANILQSGIGQIMNAGTASGTYGNPAVVQLQNDLTAKAAQQGVVASQAVRDSFSTNRTNELANLIAAVKASQSGTSTTAGSQDQNQTQSSNTAQSTTDKTNQSQQTTGTGTSNTSSSATQNTSTTQKENTTGSGTSTGTGTTTQESVNFGKQVAGSSAQNVDDWIKSQLPVAKQ